VRRVLLLDQLLEDADVVGLWDFHSEDFRRIIIEKQAVERECRHWKARVQVNGQVRPVVAGLPKFGSKLRLLSWHRSK